MKVRIKFSKKGVMRYVGHLDTMRFFQKVIRRAKLPIKYSEGYSPHQIMSFAFPLGVGMTSDAEYMDIELKESVTSQDGLKALNEVMVDGIEILSFKELPDNAMNAMASVAASSYIAYYKEKAPDYSFDALVSKVTDFIQQSSIEVLKSTKKGDRIVDVKPLIYEMEVLNDSEYGLCYKMLLSAESGSNLKPELLLKAFHEFLGLDDSEFRIGVHRIDLYTRENDEFLSLGEVGHDIL